MAQTLKRLPGMQETWVQFLDREDPLGKEMATHSNTLAWRIPWTEEPGGLQSMGSQSRTRLSDFTSSLHMCSREREREREKELSGRAESLRDLYVV